MTWSGIGELAVPDQGLGRDEVLKDEHGVFDAWVVKGHLPVRHAFGLREPDRRGSHREGRTAWVNALVFYRSKPHQDQNQTAAWPSAD